MLRRTPLRRIPHRLSAAAVVAAGVLVLLAGPAQAHDQLISTNPPAKAQVPALPDQVVLTFEEPPLKTGSQVLIKGPNGSVATGSPAISGDTVTQAIAPGSPAGAYTVTWRITSDDGHAVFGRFGFTAGTGNTSARPTSTTTAAAAPSATSTTSPASTSKSGAGKALWLLVLLVLLVPIWLFVRRGHNQMREMSER
jgi:copper resistance protein C